MKHNLSSIFLKCVRVLYICDKKEYKKKTNVLLKLFKNQENIGSFMKSIITEEIKLRQRAVEYAIKHDNNLKFQSNF